MVSIVASTIDIPSLACYYLLLKLQTAQPHTCRDEEPFVPWLGQDVRYWGGTPHALNSVLAASTCLRVFFFFLLATSFSSRGNSALLDVWQRRREAPTLFTRMFSTFIY